MRSPDPCQPPGVVPVAVCFKGETEIGPGEVEIGLAPTGERHLELGHGQGQATAVEKSQQPPLELALGPPWSVGPGVEQFVEDSSAPSPSLACGIQPALELGAADEASKESVVQSRLEQPDWDDGRQPQDGRRCARARDAVSNLHIGGSQVTKPMDDDLRGARRPLSTDRDLDPRIDAGKAMEERGPMRRNGAWSASQGRSHDPLMPGGGCAGQAINAGVHGHKEAFHQPVFGDIARDLCLEQLPSADHTVLPSGDLGEDPVGVHGHQQTRGV